LSIDDLEVLSFLFLLSIEDFRSFCSCL